jgi:hypothetical protein
MHVLGHLPRGEGEAAALRLVDAGVGHDAGVVVRTTAGAGPGGELEGFGGREGEVAA